MEVLEDNVYAGSSLAVDNDVKSFLLETAKWAKFIAIVGFVGLGLMVLGGLVVMIMGNTISTMGGRGSSVPIAFMGFVYLLMAVLYFFPILYLYRAAVGLKNGINSNNQETFKNGFENFKSHYKFIGILLIVVLSLYVLLIVFAGVMGVVMR